jgi:hypothetical protein
MSIASQTLSKLQLAGSAVHGAVEALKQELEAHSRALMIQVATQPFGQDADSAYQQMRQVARLVHEMNSLEQQIRSIYLDAAQKVQAEVPVLPALPSARARKLIKGRGDALADDAIEDATLVVTTQPEKSAPRSTRSKAASEVAKVKNKPARTPKPNNTDRLHQTLQKLLGKKARAIGHAELALTSGLPRGSIGASIKKLIEAQRLILDAEGKFKIA